MAPIPLARQQQVTAQVVQPTLVQPQRAGPDPVTGALVEGTNQMAAFTDKLAEAEKKQLDMTFRNSIAAELSQFETDSRARVIELEAKGTGDTPFVKGVLDDFQERASKVGEKYSQEFQDEIKVKLLPIQETVAAAALAAQTRKTNEQVLANADLFQNNLTNQVRFGAIGEQGALAKLEEFSQTVPDNLRLGVATKIREQVRVASMGRSLEANPAAFMKQVKAGAFNDIDPTYVSRAYEGAARTLVEQREKAERAREKILDLAEKDPLNAARQSLGMRGVRAPTRDQLYSEQIKLGVHPADVAVVDKRHAVFYMKNLSSAQDLDQFRGMMAQLKADTIEKGEDWGVLQKNLSRFAREEDLPNLAQAMDVVENAGHYPVETQMAVFEMMRDPKAADASRKLLSEDNKKKVVEEALSSIQDHISAMNLSGASPDQVQKAQQFAVDTAVIAAARTGKTDRRFISSVVSPPATLTKLRLVDNRDAYYVPASMEKTFSTEHMDSIRVRILSSQKVDVPPTYPSEMRANLDIKNRAGWTTYGDSGVALTVNGVQVYADGKPVIKTWDELALGIHAAEEEAAALKAESPVTPVNVPSGQGTIVLGK